MKNDRIEKRRTGTGRPMGARCIAVVTALAMTACGTQSPLINSVLSSQVPPKHNVIRDPIPIGPAPSASVAALFAKGKVTGAELIGTLTAIRDEVRARKSAEAWLVLNATLDRTFSSAGSNGSFGISDVMINLAAHAGETLLKQTAASVATKALDEHMQSMIDNPRALADETIQLPPAAGLNAKQADNILMMAALTVGARVTRKMLKTADADLEGLRKDYGALLDTRERAATILFTAIGERDKVVQNGSVVSRSALLATGLTDADASFFETDLSRLSVGEFAKDMAAQNLALGYLNKVQPKAFSDYRSKADDTVRRTKTYLRSMTGIAAFAALSVNFMRISVSVSKDKSLVALLKIVPLMGDFLLEAVPLAESAMSVAYKGVEIGTGGWDPFKKSFSFIDKNKPVAMRSARDVFGALKQHQNLALFKDALFRNDAPGLLLRIGECDRAEAGRMLDMAVEKPERETFAKAYFSERGSGVGGEFSFLNAFDDPGKTLADQNLPARLLAEDHRQKSTDRTMALSTVQREVSEKFDRWDNGQLLRLIFANRDREATARYATLSLNELHIRPVPSPDAVFAYEQAAEACKKTLLVSSPPPPVIKKAEEIIKDKVRAKPVKPQAKPAPTPVPNPIKKGGA